MLVSASVKARHSSAPPEFPTDDQVGSEGEIALKHSKLSFKQYYDPTA